MFIAQLTFTSIHGKVEEGVIAVITLSSRDALFAGTLSRVGVAELGSGSGRVAETGRAVQSYIAVTNLQGKRKLFEDVQTIRGTCNTHITLITSNSREPLLALALPVQGIADIPKGAFTIALAQFTTGGRFSPVSQFTPFTSPSFRVPPEKWKNVLRKSFRSRTASKASCVFA